MKVWHLILISAFAGGVITHIVENTVKAEPKTVTEAEYNELVLKYAELEEKYIKLLDPDSTEYKYLIGEIDENGKSFDSYEDIFPEE